MQEAIQHLRQSDPILSEIIDRVGDYRIEFRDPDFETLVKSIVYQQLSGRVASVIFGRLAKAAGGQTHARKHPQTAAVPDAHAGPLRPEDRLHSRSGAPHARRHAWFSRNSPALADEEVIERLTQVKGIGVWTVHMFLIFALRRTDVLPVGDLGIRNAIRKAYGLAELPQPPKWRRSPERWRPYCTVASWYLWRSLEPNANL